MIRNIGRMPNRWMDRAAVSMRARRFARFAAVVDALPKPLTILDVGGRAAFWAAHGWANRSDVHIVTGNIETQRCEYSNIEPVKLDATNMSCYSDGEFDVVFSNSVIEHLSTWENQVKMANEIRRVAKAYWIQTPNYWFPMEPHFRCIGWQWLPVRIRVAILRRRRCGLRGRTPDLSRAREVVGEVRLLSRRELCRLFPTSRILTERFMGFVKSWIAVEELPFR